MYSNYSENFITQLFWENLLDTGEENLCNSEISDSGKTVWFLSVVEREINTTLHTGLLRVRGKRVGSHASQCSVKGVR